MSKFKLTQTAAEVQDILNNSLQKPTGLSKTELVGVGVNGQENIEIGDNLTLANGKLSSAAGGVNGLASDAEGNLTASKNLGVDGKLTLKSLVSDTNQDGDITKALSGAAMHVYMVIVDGMFNYPVYTSKDYGFKSPTNLENFWTDEHYKELRPTGKQPASGFLYKDIDGTNRVMCAFVIGSTPNSCYAYGYDIKKQQIISGVQYIPGLRAQVRQLY